MIFVDAHVHMYDCFDADFFLDSALNNFQAVAKQYNLAGHKESYLLLLAESQTENYFQQWHDMIDPGNPLDKTVGTRWRGYDTGKADTLLMCRDDLPEQKLYLVAGGQIVTTEKIEVLSLFCNHNIHNGLSLSETVEFISQSGGLPVLPWGVGKWFGKRGKIVKDFVSDHPGSNLYVGDNGGRPVFWPNPSLFQLAEKKGVAVLPGTDPLPLPDEASRVGSFGFYLQGDDLLEDSPVAYLKRVLLSQEAEIVPFGDLQKMRLFFASQLRLRFSS